jgi:uncharacterized protein YjbI with pentapeptide repeats
MPRRCRGNRFARSRGAVVAAANVGEDDFFCPRCGLRAKNTRGAGCASRRVVSDVFVLKYGRHCRKITLSRQENTNMANPKHLAILKEGSERWNTWRSQVPEVIPDLRGRDLSGAYIGLSNIEGLKFHEHASQPEDDGANLRGFDLSNYDLSTANLTGADLRNAKLHMTNFELADLTCTYVVGANFEKAIFGGTVFGGIDLQQTVGLKEAVHRGPSVLGIDTLVASQGNISEEFLRGCGVPDQIIVYARSLVGNPIEFYSCFISYSSKDQKFADRLYADLQAKGVRCWFASHDIAAGRKIHEQIDQAIRVYDRLPLILSDASMSSNWVKTEIANARAREEREGRQMLFPVTLVPFEQVRGWRCFDADTGIDSAREVREYFIPDFSRWTNHDAYQKAFERLLRDLKKAGESTAGANGDGERSSQNRDSS